MSDIRDKILLHIGIVQESLLKFRRELHRRGDFHDMSKLRTPEINMYAELTNQISRIEEKYGYGSPEYEQCIKDNQDAFSIHFHNNRHHPEYHENGIDDMNLVDIVEMLCDWRAAAMARGKPVDLEVNRKRFHISDQLIRILENTIRDFEW